VWHDEERDHGEAEENEALPDTEPV
jgi:hypothetical protein